MIMEYSSMYNPLFGDDSPDEIELDYDFEARDVIDSLPNGCDGVLLNWEVVNGNNTNIE